MWSPICDVVELGRPNEMTFDELTDWLNKNRDKVFEFAFGDYWMQMPFGLVADVIERVYAYAKQEKQNESSISGRNAK